MAKTTTDNELFQKLEDARAIISVGAQYKHYKGGVYTVLNLAILESSEEIGVIYQAEYGNHLPFIRPFSSWVEIIEVNNSQITRFTRI